MVLRDYQVEMCHRVMEALAKHRSVMVQMPMGTGKTLVLAQLVMEVMRGTKAGAEVLLVSHRRELVEQIEQTVGWLDFAPQERRAIHVVSVQGLWRNGLELDFVPELVIVDEAHHALARTYRSLWERWPKARFLGLTATPCRLSGEGFTDLFEVMVASWSVRRFISAGWLVGYDYYSIRPDSEEQGLVDSLVKRGADGDYQLKEMRGKLDVAPSIERLYESWAQHAADRRGLVYAMDIEHAEHIAAYYRNRGVKAQVVSARTAPGVRRKWVEALRSGELQVLVNVDLFSEGFDCPEVGFIQLARPTLSLSRYLQMVGRGLRRSEGKECCIILDNVGLYRAFGLPSAEHNWQAWFEGRMSAGARPGRTAGALCAGGLIPTSLCERGEGHVVKIASHEMFDRRNGYWLEPEDMSLGGGRTDFGGIELETADGRWFFPTCARGVLKKEDGIHRKALETMVGAGLAWKGIYIPFDRPDELFTLESKGPDWERVYRDDRGNRWWQRDPEARLVPYEARQGEPAVETEGAAEEPLYFTRGFVQLCREGDLVYILNLREEAGKAYRSWEIRADGRICTVGPWLYFAGDAEGRPYRIKRRTEDFRLFIVETDFFNVTQGHVVRYDWQVLNEVDRPLKKELIKSLG